MIIFQNQLANDKLVGKIVIIFNYFFINRRLVDKLGTIIVCFDIYIRKKTNVFQV